MATVTAVPMGGSRGGPSMSTPINTGLHDPGRLQVCHVIACFSSMKNIWFYIEKNNELCFFLQPSYSTEELNQEMANLEGLMKDLNAITASEFECWGAKMLYIMMYHILLNQSSSVLLQVLWSNHDTYSQANVALCFKTAKLLCTWSIILILVLCILQKTAMVKSNFHVIHSIPQEFINVIFI